MAKYDDTALQEMIRTVIFEAVRDRKQGLLHQHFRKIYDTERFFKSAWFGDLASFIDLNVSGEQILKLIDKRVEESRHEKH